jgi:hypothetical protein
MYLRNKTACQLKEMAARLVREGDCANSLHRRKYGEIVEALTARTFGANPLPSDLTNAQLKRVKAEAESARIASELEARRESLQVQDE